MYTFIFLFIIYFYHSKSNPKKKIYKWKRYPLKMLPVKFRESFIKGSCIFVYFKHVKSCYFCFIALIRFIFIYFGKSGTREIGRRVFQKLFSISKSTRAIHLTTLKVCVLRQ